MAKLMKITLLAIFLCVINTETARAGLCSYLDLKISQVQTGAKIQKKPQWNVTVNNDCICTEFNIELSCSGFKTVEKIDPSVLTIGKDTCLLLKDGRLYGFNNFSFTYAWDTRYPFRAVNSNRACS